MTIINAITWRVFSYLPIWKFSSAFHQSFVQFVKIVCYDRQWIIISIQAKGTKKESVFQAYSFLKCDLKYEKLNVNMIQNWSQVILLELYINIQRNFEGKYGLNTYYRLLLHGHTTVLNKYGF